jgi:hypothetical protein
MFGAGAVRSHSGLGLRPACDGFAYRGAVLCRPPRGFAASTIAASASALGKSGPLMLIMSISVDDPTRTLTPKAPVSRSWRRGPLATTIPVEPSRGPNGGVADTLDEAKAAFLGHGRRPNRPLLPPLAPKRNLLADEDKTAGQEIAQVFARPVVGGGASLRQRQSPGFHVSTM